MGWTILTDRTDKQTGVCPFRWSLTQNDHQSSWRQLGGWHADLWRLI